MPVSGFARCEGVLPPTKPAPPFHVRASTSLIFPSPFQSLTAAAGIANCVVFLSIVRRGYGNSAIRATFRELKPVCAGGFYLIGDWGFAGGIRNPGISLPGTGLNPSAGRGQTPASASLHTHDTLKDVRNPMIMPVVGILGGIGSGKSSVVGAVTDVRLEIINADRIGHEMLDNWEILSHLRKCFDLSVFDEHGRIVRTRLAQLVFGETAEHRDALNQLEQILHPEIGREIERRIQNFSGDAQAIVIDAALLLEARWGDRCDCLIFVDTPQSVRETRVRENRGWSAEELCRREAAQMPVEVKRRRAHHIVDNSGTIEHATAQISAFLRTMAS